MIERLLRAIFPTDVTPEADPIEHDPAPEAPAWTDENQSDPGTTIMQLFAWATESISYRTTDQLERGQADADGKLIATPEPHDPKPDSDS